MELKDDELVEELKKRYPTLIVILSHDAHFTLYYKGDGVDLLGLIGSARNSLENEISKGKLNGY